MYNLQKRKKNSRKIPAMCAPIDKLRTLHYIGNITGGKNVKNKALTYCLSLPVTSFIQPGGHKRNRTTCMFSLHSDCKMFPLMHLLYTLYIYLN